MVVAWGSAEQALVHVFCQITGLTFVKATTGFFKIPTFEARVNVLRALVGEWDPPSWVDKKAVDAQIDGLSSLAAARNRWIHSTWSLGSSEAGKTGETVTFSYRYRSDHKDRRHPVKAADVLNHVRAVRERRSALYDLLRKPSA